MNKESLIYQNFVVEELSKYRERASTESSQFLKWFLENIFRLDDQTADDACVDESLDKGVDGIFVDDTDEIIYLFQSKLSQNEKSSIREVEVKEFYASLAQFDTVENIQKLLLGNAGDKLKNAISRQKVVEKKQAGYATMGVFFSNAKNHEDAISFVDKVGGIELFDRDRIASEFVDLEVAGGVASEFTFNISDTGVIDYATADGISAKLFLAKALQLVHLEGISDGSLFEKNVRLSLGNTKVNRALVASIRDKKEHRNFALYHNGINIVCDELAEGDGTLTIKNYTVVNGAQSLSSLFATKSKITDDLRIVVKVIATHGEALLSEKITRNSNNQNAIKARDLRSNHGIQQRLKREIDGAFDQQYSFEVKRGESGRGRKIIVNEEVGLFIMAIDLGQPYNCHQKYRVMDESYSDIFGRPNLTGSRVVAIFECGKAAETASKIMGVKEFGNYTLTKYLLAHFVTSIIKTSPSGAAVIRDMQKLVSDGQFPGFIQDFSHLAKMVAIDFNAELKIQAGKDTSFDYKNQMKSNRWCSEMQQTLIASYEKEVLKEGAKPIEDIFSKYV